MSSLAEHELASPLLRLPAETRLHIYSYLIPSSGLEIDLCNPPRPDQTEFTFRKRSIVSNLLSQFLSLDLITRTNGLHLLLVSQRTRSEVLPLLSNTVVRFHCPRCFEEVLRNLSHGFGVGVKWMKHVEIVVDLFQTRQLVRAQMLTRQLVRYVTKDALNTCKKTAWLFYGRLDLTGQEQWKCRPLVERRSTEDDQIQTLIDTASAPINANGQATASTIQGQGNFHGEVHPDQKWLLIGDFFV